MSLIVNEVGWAVASEVLRLIRGHVFIEEQGVPRELEWDGQDEDAVHFLARLDDAAVGTARLLLSGQIGRMAVLAQHRRAGIGRLLLQAAIQHARMRGDREVFLHAQRSAEPFYTAAGFFQEGREFDEAGIAHIGMRLVLDLPYETVDLPAIAKSRPRVVRTPKRSSVLTVTGDVDLAAAVLTVAQSAKRILRIRSVQLARAVFDNAELEAVLSTLARRHAQCQVRILLADPQAFASSSHRLLSLARRLPTPVQMRAARSPGGESLESLPTYVVADDKSVFVQSHSDASSAFVDLAASAQARNLSLEFDQAWDRAGDHPELRELRI